MYEKFEKSTKRMLQNSKEQNKKVAVEDERKIKFIFFMIYFVW